MTCQLKYKALILCTQIRLWRCRLLKETAAAFKKRFVQRLLWVFIVDIEATTQFVGKKK